MVLPDNDRAAGVQSLERAVHLLQAVASMKRRGARMADVMERTGLSKTTAHRMLQTLIAVGFIDQDEASGLYFLGLDLVSLALMSANRHDLIDLVMPSMERLAERTGDTVYLIIRNRHTGICVERVEGSFPIKTLTLDRGDRRPLGVGAGNLAILAFLPEEEIAKAIDANSAAIAQYGDLDAAAILVLAEQTRSQGYAFNEGRIVAGMSAVGIPIMDVARRPVASLSVAAVSERMRAERRANIVSWLSTEAAVVEAQLRRVLGEVTGTGVAALLPRRSQRR